MNTTIEISESVVLDEPAAGVWKYVEDYSNDLQWRKGLNSLTPDPPGPAAVGTKVHQVVTKLGSTHTMTSVVTETGPGYSYRFSGESDTGRIEGRRQVTQNDQGKAVFTFDITMHLAGIYSLAGPLIARIMARGLRSDLATLAAVIGTEPTAATRKVPKS